MFVLVVVLSGLFLACLLASMFKVQEGVKEEGSDVERGRSSRSSSRCLQVGDNYVDIQQIFKMENRKIATKICLATWHTHYDGNMEGMVGGEGKTLGDIVRDAEESHLLFTRTYESLGQEKGAYDYKRRVYVSDVLRHVCSSPLREIFSTALDDVVARIGDENRPPVPEDVD